MAEVKWIKIVTDIFDDEKVLLIEQLPESDSIIVIWFKLLCLAGKQNNSGVFMINDKIPYTDEMLSAIFRRKIETVRSALRVFEQFGMVEIVNGVITIPNWGKHQSLDRLEERRDYMRNYMREYRKGQEQIACKVNGKANSNANGKANVSSLDKNKNKIREDIEIENNISNDILPRATSSTVPNESVFIKLPLISNQDFIISFEKVAELQELYPAIDVEQGLRNMKGWLISNPRNRKTEKGIMRFITGWLSREQDKARPQKQQEESVLERIARL